MDFNWLEQNALHVRRILYDRKFWLGKIFIKLPNFLVIVKFSLPNILLAIANVESTPVCQLCIHQFFKPGACSLWRLCCACLFLEIVLFTHWHVCVHPSPKALITSQVKHMHNNHIKQFYSFSVSLLWHFLLINWLAMALVTLRVMNACQRRLR